MKTGRGIAPMMGKKTEKTDPRLFALGRRNLLLIAVAFVVIILGFALMAGAGSTPEHYNPRHIQFQTHRIGADDRFPRFCFHGICHFVQRS